ncbi:MAG: glycosyltransferase [Bacteroidales bacterium]|nr:glycosyltransferase [Clostridium sp.]MCM1203290.1 glycosyltransferase [Bacteroidales bacterium]
MEKVGVVLLNYKTAMLTSKLAKKFSRFQCIHKIAIVDNASKDESLVVFNELLVSDDTGKIVILKSNENVGYARGNNIGLKYLVENEKSSIVFVANPDIDICEKSVNNIVNAFDNNEYAILSCLRKYVDSSPIRQYWTLPTYGDLMFQSLAIGRRLASKKAITTIQSDDVVFTVDCVPGAFWAGRGEVLKQINYLDEGTFLYYEENCLAQKIKQFNMKEGLVLDAIYSTDSSKSSTVSIRKNGMGFEYLTDSKLFYAKKYICKNKLQYCVLKLLSLISIMEYKFIGFAIGGRK